MSGSIVAAMADVLAHGAHLVGSVPLASAETVFETVAEQLGDRLRRLPDGETGPRSDWIVWQLPVFTRSSRWCRRGRTAGGRCRACGWPTAPPPSA
jgi:hypothetical protein